MSAHPNVILMAVLTPHGLARITMRAILTELNSPGKDVVFGARPREIPEVTIDDDEYHTLIMEDTYDEGFQITAKLGDLVFFNMVTYGYGERVTWRDLERQKIRLEAWAIKACIKHHCDYEIFITANHW